MYQHQLGLQQRRPHRPNMQIKRGPKTLRQHAHLQKVQSPRWKMFPRAWPSEGRGKEGHKSSRPTDRQTDKARKLEFVFIDPWRSKVSRNEGMKNIETYYEKYAGTGVKGHETVVFYSVVTVVANVRWGYSTFDAKEMSFWTHYQPMVTQTNGLTNQRILTPTWYCVPTKQPRRCNLMSSVRFSRRRNGPTTTDGRTGRQTNLITVFCIEMLHAMTQTRPYTPSLNRIELC